MYPLFGAAVNELTFGGAGGGIHKWYVSVVVAVWPLKLMAVATTEAEAPVSTKVIATLLPAPPAPSDPQM
jgi:hypothetical protein